MKTLNKFVKFHVKITNHRLWEIFRNSRGYFFNSLCKKVPSQWRAHPHPLLVSTLLFTFPMDGSRSSFVIKLIVLKAETLSAYISENCVILFWNRITRCSFSRFVTIQSTYRPQD